MGRNFNILSLVIIYLLLNLCVIQSNISADRTPLLKILNYKSNALKITYFNATVVSPYKVKLIWQISENLSDVYVRVFRIFLDHWSEIAIVPANYGSFIDSWVYYGTEYEYAIELINIEGETLDLSSPVKVITPIDENALGAPRFSWEEYKERKYPFHPDDYLQYDTINFKVYTYMLHGVNVTVAVDNKIYETVSTSTIKDFVVHIFRFFHRHWTTYQAFPVKEYRVVIFSEKEGPISEDELGLQYGVSMITIYGPGEKLSHEIGHAWIGGLIYVERNLGGEEFDPDKEDSDKWILEGFEHLYGIVRLDYNEAMLRLNESLERYHRDIIGGGLDMPLVDMPVYFGTENAWTYYVKGGLVAYLINKILIENDNKTLNDFMSYLYRKYNITSWEEREDTAKLISTEELLSELNEFSRYEFTEFFDKYVYGTEILPINRIDGEYIKALQDFNESVGLIADEVPPVLSIITPINGTIFKNNTFKIRWEAYDLGSGLDHFEIKIDESNWKNIGLNSSYIISNLSPGHHIISIKAIDKAGNSATIKVVIEIERGIPLHIILSYSLIIILIASIIAIYFYRRKKG